MHTGYWSLVAALDRGKFVYSRVCNRIFFVKLFSRDIFLRGCLALEEGIPFTDPAFYASEERCPDSLIRHIFRGAPQAREAIPLLSERIAIMREVGTILCSVCVEFCHSIQPLNEVWFRNTAGRSRDSSKPSSVGTIMTVRRYNWLRW